MNSWLNIEGVRMTRSFVRVYSEEAELKTDERKHLYKELMEEDVFGERGKGFARALKRLVFEGELEAYDISIVDPNAFLGRRENDLGHMMAVYLCLAAPLPDVEFYKKILRLYAKDIILDISIAAVSYIDGSPVSADLIERVGVLISAAADVFSEGGGSFEESGAVYYNLFGSFFSRVCYEGSSHNSLFPRFLKKIDSVFMVVLERSAKGFELCARKLLPKLFGSAPVSYAAYADEQFILFLKGYFSREYTPALLEYLDAVYYLIPEEKRIRLDGDKISYFAD